MAYNMNGTKIVAKGEGSTRHMLYNALVAFWRASDARELIANGAYALARKNVAFKPGKQQGTHSNIMLTGASLNQDDLVAISKAKF